jgi:Pyridoxal-dependent decarboxylase conserved domain
VTSLLARNVGILLATLAYLGLAILARGGLAALFSHPALIALTIETRVLDWLRGMIGLPADFRGVVQDSASIATLAALLAARKKALGGLGNRDGLAARCFSPVGWRAADVRKPRHHTGAIRLGSNTAAASLSRIRLAASFMWSDINGVQHLASGDARPALGAASHALPRDRLRDSARS